MLSTTNHTRIHLSLIFTYFLKHHIVRGVLHWPEPTLILIFKNATFSVKFYHQGYFLTYALFILKFNYKYNFVRNFQVWLFKNITGKLNVIIIHIPLLWCISFIVWLVVTNIKPLRKLQQQNWSNKLRDIILIFLCFAVHSIADGWGY